MLKQFKMREIIINICGDFYINDCAKKFDLIGEDIIDLFKLSNFNIINLESPITQNISKNKIIKTGPHLNGSSNTFSVLKRLNTHLVTLANNHIMDFGEIGLMDTILECRNSSIGFVGAGPKLNEAKNPHYFEFNGIKIAILNFAENEWASSEDNLAGANPLDIIENVKQIKEEKEKSDVVLVIIHGGHEYYNLPSPRMVKQYRYYAENGASIIIGHHTHCISGYEVHQGVPIFYSLGNFIFKMNSNFDDWYTGLVLNLSINLKGEIAFKLYPVRQNKDTYGINLLQGKEKDEILKRVKKYSEIIADEKLLEQYWQGFIEQRSKQYRRIFNPLNLIGNQFVRRVFYKIGLGNFFSRNNNYIEILNAIRCESHHEAIKEIINKHIGENENCNT